MEQPVRRARGRPKGTGRVDPDDIVDAALDAIAAGGYAALTMRGVARSLGVSLSSVQNHFATKADLWRAAVDKVRFEAVQRRAQVDVFDLRAAILGILEEQDRHPGLLASLLTDQGDGSTERIAYVSETLRSILELPTERLRELEEMGHTRSFDVEAFIALMTIGIGSMTAAPNALQAIYGFDISTEDDRSRLAGALADILALGLQAR